MTTDPRLQDKAWRMSHLYKVRNKKKQLVTFKRNKVQEDFSKNNHTRNIILKSRQLGFTTDEAIDMTDETLFEQNSESILIAQDQDKAKDIFDNKIKLAWDNFKLKELYEVDLNSARRLKVGFGNGSYSSVIVDLSGRSGTFNRVHITEFAKICKERPDRAKEIIEGTIPAVPTDGRVDIESTAEQPFGLFYEMFWEAWNRGEPKYPTQFKAHFYNWQWDEEIETTDVIDDLPKEFREYQKQHNLTDKEISYYYLKFIALGEHDRNWATMRKEYPTTPEEAFLAAGDKFFDLKISQALITEKPTLVLGDWKYYGDYKPGHRFALGVDVSEGVGRHNSTIVVIDYDATSEIGGKLVQRPKVVAVYASNRIPPDLLAHEIKNGATRYGNCIAVIERNNHGFATLAAIKGIYFNLYRDEQDKLGWQTNMASKPKMLHELRTAIHEGLVDIPDAALKQEIVSYPAQDLNEMNVDEEDETQGHYDRVIALALAWQARGLAQPSMGHTLKDAEDYQREAQAIGTERYGLFNEI